MNFRVVKLSPNGNLLKTWGSRGTGKGQFSGNIGEGGPTDVAVDPRNGNVYVNDPMAGRIQKFTPNGRFISEIKGGN